MGLLGSLLYGASTGMGRASYGEATNAIKSVLGTGVGKKMIGYGAAGIISGSYLGNLDKQLSNYYGESQYSAMYGNSIKAASAAAPYLGVGAGILSSMRYGPLGILRRLSNTGQRVAGWPIAFATRKSSKAFNTLNKRNARLTAAAGGRSPMTDPKAWGVRLQANPGIKNSLASYRYGNLSQSKTLHSFNNWYAGVYNSKDIGAGRLLLGGASYATAFLSTGAMLDNPDAMLSAAAGIAGLAGLSGAKLAGQILSNDIGGKKAMLVTAGAVGSFIGAGYLSSRLPIRTSAEGNIQDIRTNAHRTLRKMDFNTAGLVQALHNQR